MIGSLMLALAAQGLTNLGADDARLRRAAELATEPRFEVRCTVSEAGDDLLTLLATPASFRRVVEHVGSELGRSVKGLELISRDPIFYARLEAQPLEDALAWVAGSVGLAVRVGPRTIEVSEELSSYPTRDELFKRASDSLWKAIVRHPRSAQAPRAAWIRAEIDADSGARPFESGRAFDALIDEYPDSDLVAEAYLEAGKQYGRAGRWDLAIERFDDLASYRKPHPFGVEARRRLADAHTRLGEEAKNPDVARENANRALLVLNSLDDVAPSVDASERRERLLIRARAYSLAGQPLDALRSIDLAATYSVDGDRDIELMDLRANALDRAGQHDDAFRAWLSAAQDRQGDARGAADRRAAASANFAKAHIAALAACKTAENEGLANFVREERNRAEIALGMDLEVGLLGDRERIAQAERLSASRQYDRTVDLLRPVFDRRHGLERTDRQRLVKTYAVALDRAKRLDEAIHSLRTAAQESEYSFDRRELYQLASSILERNGELERAIAALNGSL